MQIYIVAGKGAEFGWGHWQRMLAFQKILDQKRLLNFLEPWPGLLTNNKITENISEQKTVIIWDCRDQLPPEAWQKQHNLKVILLDNLNSLRFEKKAANFYFYDTLPHLQNSRRQNLEILKNKLLIHPKIIKKSRRVIIKSPRIRFTKRRIFRQLMTHKNFYHIFQSQRRRKGIALTKFHHLLSKKENIFSYFGQSVFESLIFGKKIILCPISSYHHQLNQMLYRLYLSNRNLFSRIACKKAKGLARLINCAANSEYL